MTVFLLAAVCVGTVGAVSVSDFNGLKSAIETANQNPTTPYIIVVGSDIPVSSSDYLPAIIGTITLTTSENQNHKIYRTAANTTNKSGIFTVGTNGKLTLQNNGSGILTLDGNKSSITGNKQQLVYVNGGVFTMNGGNITENDISTENYGGGVYITSGSFIMQNGVIYGNSAGERGGGVYLDSGIFSMAGGVIANNSATYGGGVRINGGIFELSGSSIITNNTAINYGGGVHAGNCEFKMTGGTISNNFLTATDNNRLGGGLALVTGSKSTISGGMITNNSAKLGAGIFLQTGELTMDGGVIANNTASQGGAGVYINKGGYFLLSKSGSITNNTASWGGAGVSVATSDAQRSKFEMTGGSITNNKGNSGGGVMISSNCLFIMSGGIISNNCAENYQSSTNGIGGGVYVDSGTFKMLGGSITNNKAAQSGKAVYIKDDIFEISDDATIDTNNDVYLNAGNVSVGGTKTFSGSVMNITGSATTITQGYNLIKINTSSPFTTSDIKNKFGIRSTEYYLKVTNDKNLTVWTIEPKITNESIPDGEVGESYSEQIIATGAETASITWTNSTLPAGLSVSPSGKTLTISGSPTTEGVYTFWVNATNTGGFDNKTFTLTIYEVIEPALPISEPTKDNEGNTTITNTTSGTITVNGNIAIIGDSSDDVTVKVTFEKEPTETTTSGNLKEINGKVTNVLASYKEALAGSSDSVNGGTLYQLNLTLKNVTTQLPTINPAFDEANSTLIEKRGAYQTLAMISATASDMTKVNGNISENGIEIIFKIPKSGNTLSKVKAFHIKGQNQIEDVPSNMVNFDSADPTYYIIKVKGSTFSTYAIAKDDTKDPEPPKESSGSQGSSVWLMETQTPTPTPTETPTQTDAVPTDIPDVKPTQTPDSPAPILGILAGLGFCVAVRRRR